MEKIAVTCGSGFVGQVLIPLLRESGHEAFALRRPYSAGDLDGVTTIINLAGENLSAGRWTSERKRRITGSRVNTLNNIRELLLSGKHSVKTLISASAVGYYGTMTSDHIYFEDDPAGNDFLAGVCREWELAADSFGSLGVRVAKVRIGVVFSEKGGALPKLMLPLKFGIAAPLGSGRQWIPWIRIEDLAGIFKHLVENSALSGPFNAAAPSPVTNRQLMQMLARRHRRLFLPIGVPAFLLRLALGEMAMITLEGSRVSTEKIISSGFEFHYPKLEEGE